MTFESLARPGRTVPSQASLARTRRRATVAVTVAVASLALRLSGFRVNFKLDFKLNLPVKPCREPSARLRP